MQTSEREHDYEIHELRACVWRALYAVRDESCNVPVYAGYDGKGAQPIIGDVTEFYETLDSKLREHSEFLHATGCFAKAPNRMQTLEGLFLGTRPEDAPVTGAGRGAPFVMQLWFAVHAFLQCMRGQQVLLLETHPDRAYTLDSDSDADSGADSDASFVSAKSCQSSPRCVPSSLPPVLEATSSVLLRGDLFDRKRQCVVTGAVLVQVFELLEADTRKVLTKFELPEPLTPAHLEPYMVDSESESEGEST